MSRFVDLHTHSTFSDGTLTPRVLVQEACKAGLSAIALTDHDVLEGLEEARAAGREAGVEIVAGVEISARSRYGEVHVLGFDVDAGEAPGSALQRALDRQRDARRTRAAAVLQKLEALGMPLDPGEVRTIAGAGSVGRPHIAAAMVSRGYVGSIEQAFARYLKEGGPAYVAREAVTAEEAVALIRGAGGLASVAHPAFVRTRDPDELERFLAGLAEAGLEGLECFTSAHDDATTSAFLRIARRLALVPTGGSDYHGDRKTNVRLGRTRGGGRIPYAVLGDLRARLARRREAPVKGGAIDKLG